MKRLSFGEILGRAVIAISVAIAPTASVLAQAVPDEIHGDRVVRINFHERVRMDYPKQDHGFKVSMDLPPSMVFSTTVQFNPPNEAAQTHKYETIVIRTESYPQYQATMKWLNAQMTEAKVNNITYSFKNLVPDTVDGDKAGEIVEEDIQPEHRNNFVNIPVTNTKRETHWARKIWTELGKKTLKAIGPKGAAAILAGVGSAKMTALSIARRELVYRATFTLTRVIINGSQAGHNIYKSTADLGVSLLAGIGYMGGLSGALQWYISDYNEKFLRKAGPVTRASQRTAVKLAEKILGTKLNEEQVKVTHSRIRKLSATNKWGLTEAVFYGGAQLIIYAAGYAVLSDGIASWFNVNGGILEPSLNFIAAVLGSMAAQSSFDTGNSEHKELAERKAETEDDLIMADFMESLRGLMISILSVGALSATMTSPEIGYATMATMAVTGILYRTWVSKKTAAFECEERLKRALKAERMRQQLLEIRPSDI